MEWSAEEESFKVRREMSRKSVDPYYSPRSRVCSKQLLSLCIAAAAAAKLHTDRSTPAGRSRDDILRVDIYACACACACGGDHVQYMQCGLRCGPYEQCQLGTGCTIPSGGYPRANCPVSAIWKRLWPHVGQPLVRTLKLGKELWRNDPCTGVGVDALEAVDSGDGRHDLAG